MGPLQLCIFVFAYSTIINLSYGDLCLSGSTGSYDQEINRAYCATVKDENNHPSFESLEEADEGTLNIFFDEIEAFDKSGMTIPANSYYVFYNKGIIAYCQSQDIYNCTSGSWFIREGATTDGTSEFVADTITALECDAGCPVVEKPDITGSIQCGSIIDGNLDTVGYSLYEFNLATDQYILISTCGSAFDTSLWLYDDDWYPNGTETEWIYHQVDSDECGGQSILMPNELVTAGDYYLAIGACCCLECAADFGDMSDYYSIEVECDPDSQPEVSVGIGTNVGGDCNFADTGDGPVVPIGVCHRSVDATATSDGTTNEEAESMMWVCNDNNDGVINQIYSTAECSGTPDEEIEFVSLWDYTFNCNGTANGCDLARIEIECSFEEGDTEYSYTQKLTVVNDMCSTAAISNKVTCTDSTMVFTEYSDNECMTESEVIPITEIFENQGCEVDTDCDYDISEDGDGDGDAASQYGLIFVIIMVGVHIFVSN